MTNISASLVKELRDKTGAGMMDCKTALTETKGDIEQAVDWLRKKGLSKAANKAGRIAAEGLIGVTSKDKSGAIVEVNSETDFVARNEQFQDMVRTIASLAPKADGDLDKLLALHLSRQVDDGGRPRQGDGGHHRREHERAPHGGHVGRRGRRRRVRAQQGRRRARQDRRAGGAREQGRQGGARELRPPALPAHRRREPGRHHRRGARSRR